MNDLEAGPKGEERAIISPASTGSDVDEGAPIIYLIWHCHQSLVTMDKHYRVQMIGVLAHRRTEGNETSRNESEYPFTGHESASSISSGVSMKAVRDWTN
jgi:hypothetical protein